jgi:transketolase
MPNMSVWRPCDTVETAVAWQYAIERQNGPTSLVLTRQGLPYQKRSALQIEQIARGGYVLNDTDGIPDIVLIATGSEVHLAVAAAEQLATDGVQARVVSMPSTDVFEAQEEAYQESVLPAAVTARVVIEAGVTATWWRYAGPNGEIIGLDRFGESAPADELFEHFGFTADNVVKVAKDILN